MKNLFNMILYKKITQIKEVINCSLSQEQKLLNEVTLIIHLILKNIWL